MPGVGILVVPLLAYAFGGMASTGLMLPMLVFADVFAVLWYKRHAQWDRLVGLLPWVVVGMAAGYWTLFRIGESKSQQDVLGAIIGYLVLLMLLIYLAQRFLGDRLSPRSKFGVASTGASAGFATFISNAAGPIMQIYMSAQNLPKEQFMGTIAWCFFIINLSKLPLFYSLSVAHPNKPMITAESMLIDVKVIPAILVGVFIGKWLLPRIPQKLFDTIVLVLSAAYALKLVHVW